MSDETTNEQAGGITISHKPSDRYDSALIVVKGGSPTDALATYQDPNMKPLIEMAAKVDVFIKDTFAKEAPEREPAPKRTPPRNEAPGGEARECQHGQMVFRTGTKEGRVWRAFFCPAQKGDPTQCKPQFLRD